MTTDVVGEPEHASSKFSTAMAHLYRGEMNRLTVWRQRLDVTSNWAIILATGLATFTLGHPDVPHYTLLLGLALLGISILIEGRRYRHLHHCKWRVYLLEFGFFAEQLHPMHGPGTLPDWRRILAADLRHFHFLISTFTAVRVRLRRNYLLLVLFVTAAWLVKLYIHPTKPVALGELWQRLAVGELLPPWFVGITAVGFIGCAAVFALTCPSAERIEDWSSHYLRLSGKQEESGERG